MSTIALSVALAAALCFALTSALQHRAASREPTHRTMDPRLLLRLLRRPLWLAGEVAHVAGTGLQALALTLGALALVQPVLACALFLAIPLQAAITRRRPHRREIAAVALASCGLAVFILTARPASGISMPSISAWGWTAAVFVPMLTCCFALARRWTGARRATCLGLASGAMNGVAAALLKTCTERGVANPLALLTDWRPYTLVVVGISALLLNQNAFQGASLAAPLTALTLSEPIVGLAIGVTAFRENLSADGLRTLVLVVAVMAMVRAIWLAGSGHPVLPGKRASADKADKRGTNEIPVQRHDHLGREAGSSARATEREPATAEQLDSGRGADVLPAS